MHGVVAHLGERIAGSDEVESSSLFGSTIEKMQYSSANTAFFFCSSGLYAPGIFSILAHIWRTFSKNLYFGAHFCC